jgi:hypothetical protein
MTVLAVVLSLTGTACAATGGNFILGAANTAAKTIALTGTPPTGPGSWRSVYVRIRLMHSGAAWLSQKWS